jgi:hypothetical protein
MIESVYWKEELERIAKSIRRVPNPTRWTERGVCVVERDLMVGFFIVRRLLELNKLSSKTKGHKLKLYRHQRKSSRLTNLNHWDLDEHYDWEKEVQVLKGVKYVSNQFVHATVSFVTRDETRNWSDVLLVSDFDRNDQIWRVPISEIRDLFLLASDDYPAKISMIYNEEKGDYDISTD